MIAVNVSLLRLLLQVKIGNAQYQCPCHESPTRYYAALIVGFSVAAALLLVAFILILVHRCRRRRKPAQVASKECQNMPMDKKVMDNKYENISLPVMVVDETCQSMPMDKKRMDKECEKIPVSVVDEEYHSMSMEKKVAKKMMDKLKNMREYQ